MEIGDLIAQNLAAIIEAKNTSASAVAKEAGMGHTGVRDIIQRKAKNPTYATLVKLAEVLGVDVTEITSGPDRSPLDANQRELLDLWSQLSGQDREYLLNSAKGVLASRDSGKQ